MSYLEIIDQREVLGKEFRIYGDKENPLFLAKDVAGWIEHSDVSTMLRNIDEGEKVTNIVCTPGGNQEAWFLTEDGLYEVLMLSRKPIAKEFKRQVKEILKFIRRNGMYAVKQMSQLEILAQATQALLDQDKEIKRLSATQTEQAEEIKDIREIVALSPNDWRKEITNLINKMARNLGGNEHIRDIRAESYKLLNERFGVSLEQRLINKRRRMADEGICKSKRDKLNHIDVIAEDKKLIEGYVSIIKEMAIKYGAKPA